MNNTPHTPSPWKIATFDGPHEYASIEAGGEASELVCICDIPSWPCAIKEMQANARLIASAPDLLSALEKLADYVFELEGKQNICTSIWMDAREAIAKAKGE